MTVALAYVLAFPTLQSAATSYSTLFVPYVPDLNGQLVQYSALEPGTIITIVDGDRIGLTDDYQLWGNFTMWPNLIQCTLRVGNCC